MRADYTLVTGPVIEPVSIAEMQQQARISTDDELALLLGYVKTARETAEDYMNRGLLTQTWKLTMSDFTTVMWLPRAAPLASVTSVKYYDTADTLQTVSASVYTVDTVTRPGRIVLAANQLWPTVGYARLTARVEITYVVGWTTAAQVPERIKQGIKAYATALFNDRGEGLENRTFALQAAQSCWEDRISWKEPDYCEVE